MNLNFTLVIQVISFLILLGLLAKFLYRPFMNYLDKRAKDITDLIEQTKKNRELSQQQLKQAQEELHNTKKQVLEMKNSAVKEIDEHRRSEIEQAKKEAVALLERAKADIQKELDTARQGLKSEVSGLAIEIAQKILEREVKDSDHKRLIAESIKELSK